VGKIKFIFLLLLLSCNNIEYKYKVLGKLNTNKGQRDAVWYTDTLFFIEDTAYYFNTDKSLVKIPPPYKIINLK
jgi:hypothetical protein